ncbi:adenylate cyclase, partial [Anaerostipes caccae]|nr:adenylate cyclase [Anaerostipes caccae]
MSDYPCHEVEQAYLNTEPVIRIRRQDDDYYLTYKSKGLMVRREENLPLDADSYRHLLKKADGNIITKTRYKIPFDNGLTIEIDVF